jgi:SAM-dependent methyltransferase
MAADRRFLRFLYSWVTPVFDPLRAWRAVKGFRWYFADWRRYSRLPNAEPIRIANSFPMIHDRTRTTGVDAHYFYLSAWAMRRIVANRPVRHVDIGSLAMFASLLAAVVPVTYVDYRPLEAESEGLLRLAGDLLALPFPNCSILSLSCLHVAEHVGLGRYGDRLDPAGTAKTACELARVLKPGGNLYFAVPVGKPRVCFNAHRIHRAQTIRDYFSDLELVEFCGVNDDGQFLQRAGLSGFDGADFACGMFWFRKTERPLPVTGGPGV